MPRNYKRKSDRGLISDETMRSYVIQVINDNVSIRTVAKEKGVSKSVLARYVKKYKMDNNSRMSPNYQHRCIFTIVNEQLIEDYLIKMSNMFYGLTHKNTRILAYDFAKANRISVPQNWENCGMASEDWMTQFLKRHSKLSLRTPESTSIARSSSFNKTTVSNFFDILHSLLRETGLPGYRIFNLDESGLTTVPPTPKRR